MLSRQAFVFECATPRRAVILAERDACSAVFGVKQGNSVAAKPLLSPIGESQGETVV